jgi:hypothetical protein
MKTGAGDRMGSCLSVIKKRQEKEDKKRLTKEDRSSA